MLFLIIVFDFDRPLYSAVEPSRCFKCCGLHYVSDNSSKLKLTCPKCSGNRYLRDCKSSISKCVHSHNLKRNLNLDISYKHTV